MASTSPPPLPPPPLPPPPPPPIKQENTNQTTDTINNEDTDQLKIQIQKAAASLETTRALHAEHEASLHFASTLLSHPEGLPSNAATETTDGNTPTGNNDTGGVGDGTGLTEFVSGGVKDAWHALLEHSSPLAEEDANGSDGGTTATGSELQFPSVRGRLAKATADTALAASLRRAARLSELHFKREDDPIDDAATDNNTSSSSTNTNTSLVLVDALHTVSNATLDKMRENSTRTDGNNNTTTTPDWFMEAFQEKVREIRSYHAKNDAILSSSNDTTTNTERDISTLRQQIATATNSTTTQSQYPNVKRQKRYGNPIADGYDLSSILSTELKPIPSGQTFSVEEVMGKYLDLQSFHESVISTPVLNSLFSPPGGLDETNGNAHKLSYPDFCLLLLHTTTTTTSTTSDHETTLTTLSEKSKLTHRKKYARLLSSLLSYLLSFLHRTSPLLDVEDSIVGPATAEFEEEWGRYGGVSGWERRGLERSLASSADRGEEGEKEKGEGIDLKLYATVEELLEKVSPEELKVELARLGMKCGGMPKDRAGRLWRSRDTPLDRLPAKLFAKKRKIGGPAKKDDGGNCGGANGSEGGMGDVTNDGGGQYQRRVDIARLEYIVVALLDQVRPMLDATARRAERRLTQTVNEKEREMEEELNGTFSSALGGSGADGTKGDKDGDGDGSDKDDEDSDEEEDTPIYNPKGVPLGWDGKPIPYWLFKLHGLNHFYTCEICGNVSYRGRRNFEKHFTEAKHTYGMKCLGIPNTKHFHGVTKIADALKLWEKLQHTVNKDIFDGEKEEEYEDSQGNVLSRATYEDLARQGLL